MNSLCTFIGEMKEELNTLNVWLSGITLPLNVVCQWLATGQWFSPGTPVSSSDKSEHHDITEILLKVALNTITLILTPLSVQNLHLKRRI